MSVHTLRGGCHCGRNLYIVQVPPDTTEHPRLLFDPTPLHRSSLASPLPAYLRIPLAWYHSTTRPFVPSETAATIHRVYDHPPSLLTTPDADNTVSRRHFCGFCGTPLTFWSDAPRPEADYIRLALGSLHVDDLDQLDEWVGGEEEEEGGGTEEDGEEKKEEAAPPSSSTGLPWLDRFVEGSRLERRLLREQRLRRRQAEKEQAAPRATVQRDGGAATRADGTVTVEWEVVEWTEGDEADEDTAKDTEQGKASVSVRTAPAPGSTAKPSAKRARVASDDEADMDMEK